MGELVQTLLICGILSGTQPITIMGLLLVSAGEQGASRGRAYLVGGFTTQTVVLLGASVIFGATVEETSTAGRAFLGIRLGLGVLLVLGGLWLRRPPKKPAPDVPKALTKLENLSPAKAFGAGAVLADIQGPVLGSLALASAEASFSGRLVALAIYSVLATGIPLGVLILTRRSVKASNKVSGGTDWLMKNRRMLSSWVAIGLGILLAGDAALGLLLR